MMDEVMKNVEVILNLHKKGEINAEQAHDLLFSIYRSLRIDNQSDKKVIEYFPSSNTTTTWVDESFLSKQE